MSEATQPRPGDSGLVPGAPLHDTIASVRRPNTNFTADPQGHFAGKHLWAWLADGSYDNFLREQMLP